MNKRVRESEREREWESGRERGRVGKMKRDQPVQLAVRVRPTSFRSSLPRNGQWMEERARISLSEREKERVCVCTCKGERGRETRHGESERVKILAFWSWNGLAQVRGELLSRLRSLCGRDDDENLIQPNIPCTRNGPTFAAAAAAPSDQSLSFSVPPFAHCCRVRLFVRLSSVSCCTCTRERECVCVSVSACVGQERVRLSERERCIT